MHGFDSSARLCDAEGNVRDWWTPADAKRFVDETGELPKQTDAFEILPGLHLNGALAALAILAMTGPLLVADGAPAQRKRRA